MVEGEAAVGVADGDEAAIETALDLRLGGAFLALHREGVDLVAREALERRDQVGRDALRHERELLAQVLVARGEVRATVAQVGRARHRLDAAADDQLLEAGPDRPSHRT